VNPGGSWLPPARRCPAVQQWHGVRGASSGESRHAQILDRSHILVSEVTRQWRLCISPLVGSRSLISIYWITINTCNYSELPQLQDWHSTQPILTLSYIMDTVSGLFSSWLLPKDSLGAIWALFSRWWLSEHWLTHTLSLPLSLSLSLSLWLS
jgi:hypothetical protein